MEFISGQKLSAEEENGVLLGVGVAAEKKKQVGDELELAGTTFHVVGIYDNKNPIENASAIVRLADLQKLMGREGQVTEFQVAVEGAPGEEKSSRVEEVLANIQSLVDEAGQPRRLAAQKTQDYVASNTQLKLASGMAWMTSTIALVIGGVGILNTMVMSVLERTQEIGVLRAIGWRKLRIVRLIIGESLLLTVCGAVLGTLIAIVLTNVLSGLDVVPGIVHGDFSPRVLLTALGMALGVGLFGGLYPAWRGATLPPTEALRYE
jgi:putative ABC transport system permease protein